MRTLTLVPICAALAVAACAAEQEEASEADAMASGVEAPEAEETSSPPDSFAETAWLTRAEDGARFVTHFNADGTYRDLRNGDFMQAGTWTYADGPSGKQVCLEPDAEGGVKMCWQPDAMDGDKLTVAGPEDRRVELEKITYVAPDSDGSDAAQ